MVRRDKSSKDTGFYTRKGHLFSQFCCGKDAHKKYLFKIKMSKISLTICVSWFLFACLSGCVKTNSPLHFSSQPSSESPPEKEELTHIVHPFYEVIHLLGKGGESNVFLVKDQNGQRFAAKYWQENQDLLHYARGANAFERTVAVYHALQDTPYMNHLVQRLGDRVLILAYLNGTELQDYLNQRLSAPQVKSIIDQILKALTDMSARGVIARDVNPENIIVTDHNGNPRVTFLDPGAYFIVQDLVQANKKYPDDFGFFHKETLMRLLKNKPRYDQDQGVYKMGDRAYDLSPPFVFYAMLAERVDLLSRLLTKLYLVQQGSQRPLSVKVKERLRSFGYDPQYLIKLTTSTLQKQAHALLEKARFHKEQSVYTASDFHKDLNQANLLFEAIIERTNVCLHDLSQCLDKAPLEQSLVED